MERTVKINDFFERHGIDPDSGEAKTMLDLAKGGKVSRGAVKSAFKNAGFTLIELLTTIGIISLLVGILLPSLSAARNSARNIECESNLRSQGQALVVYTQDHDGYLPQKADMLPGYPASAYTSTNGLWTTMGGGNYRSEGHLIKGNYIPKDSASVFWCPSQTEYFSENDPTTGKQNLGESTGITKSNYYFRGLAEDLKPRLAANKKTKALASDFYAKVPSTSIQIVNHQNHVNAVYSDGHVDSVKAPNYWMVSQNFGGDSFPGANDGTWHQLDKGETFPYTQ